MKQLLFLLVFYFRDKMQLYLLVLNFLVFILITISPSFRIGAIEEPLISTTGISNEAIIVATATTIIKYKLYSLIFYYI